MFKQDEKIDVRKSVVEDVFKSIENIKSAIISTLDVEPHYSNCEIFAIKLQNIRALVKISTELSSGYMDYVKDQEMETKILNIFKAELIDKNITPCIVEIIYTVVKPINSFNFTPSKCDIFKTQFAQSKDEILDEIFCKYTNLAKMKISDGSVRFLVLEMCDMNLATFLRHYNFSQLPTIKSFLFMILYTLWAIIKRFKTFRHSDLHTHNIMLLTDMKHECDLNQKFLAFDTSLGVFNVPYFGMVPKIIDFGFSSIGDDVNIHRKDKYFEYTRAKNDFLWLLHDIYMSVYSHPHGENILHLLDILDPKTRYKKLNPEYINDNSSDVVSDYENMLKNPIFKEYLTPRNTIIHTYKD